MTHRVLKSQVPDDFADRVAAHAVAMRAHQMSAGDPAPAAPQDVEWAVRRVAVDGQPDDFVPDFEVIDDTPPPPTPAEIRHKLVADLRKAEQDAINAIMTPGKLRLLSLEANKARGIPDDQRSPEQVAVISKHRAILDAIEAIGLNAATQEAELDDLPDADLASWQPKPFPA